MAAARQRSVYRKTSNGRRRYALCQSTTHYDWLVYRFLVLLQTRTQSLFMRFWGERRLGVRLRCAGFHGNRYIATGYESDITSIEVDGPLTFRNTLNYAEI